jgi:hypothetical protein
MHLLAADPDWGTVPDWLAAIGTVAAFGVTYRLLRKELAAHRLYEEDRRRAQGRLVNAWLELRWRSNSEAEPWFTVKNASDEPVYQVKITIVPAGSRFAADPEAARGQTDMIVGGEYRQLLPQESRQQSIDDVEWTFATWALVLGLSFTDSRGLRWERSPDGSLTEVTKRRRRSGKDYMNAWIAGEIDQLDY